METRGRPPPGALPATASRSCARRVASRVAAPCPKPGAPHLPQASLWDGLTPPRPPQLCEREIGEEAFIAVYRYLRTATCGALEQQSVLEGVLGAHRLHIARYVLRLILLEDCVFSDQGF